jgi:hypothetical protein
LCIYTAELVSKPKRLKFTASLPAKTAGQDCRASLPGKSAVFSVFLKTIGVNKKAFL